MATLMRATGTSEPIPAGPEGVSLAQLQALVGGWIEMVTLIGTPALSLVLFLDEEGKRKGKPVNAQASVLCQDVLPGEVIVGDVVLATVLDAGTDDERVV